MFVVDETTVVKKGISRKYTSRRTTNFDDNDSGDEVVDRSRSYKDSATITYKDTKGNLTTLQPNSRLLRYKDIFKNLLKT